MTKKLDFRISTGLKDIIGSQLITNDEIAIFELVKNAYDAGATKVKIIFENVNTKDKKNNSRILISDNGKGMSLSDLNEKWLFVGFSEKKLDRIIKDYRNKFTSKNRFYAGAKGIGRFSADRLGSQFSMITKKKNENIFNQINLDWDEFSDQDEEFQTIKVDYDPLKKIPKITSNIESFTHGTVLIISDLRQQWNYKRLQDLRFHLQRLINPSHDPSNQDFKIDLIAKEFEKDDSQVDKNKIVNGPIHNFIFEKINIKTTSIKTTIKKNEIISELYDKGRFVFKLTEENKYDLLDSITIRIYYLNQVAKTTFTKSMGLEPVRYGSIFLYINGFRIHPYGNEKDDWLGLEKRRSQGFARFLSTREVMGRVELTGKQSGFIESTSRDSGLVHTPDYEQLMDFIIKKTLRRLERYVVDGLGWDSIKKPKDPLRVKQDSLKLLSKFVEGASGKKHIQYNDDLFKIAEEKETEKLSNAIKHIENLRKYATTPKEKSHLDTQIKIIKNRTKTLLAKQKLALKDIMLLQKEVDQKKQIENLIHSAKIGSQNIEGIIMEMYAELKSSKNIEKIKHFVDLISIEAQKIRSVTDMINRADFKVAKTIQTGNIVQYIERYITTIFENREIKMAFEFFNNKLVISKKFSPLIIGLILDNFIDNADKADAKKMFIRFSKKGDGLKMLIGDNGKGFHGDVNKIFDRGYSNTGGTGIGMSHVKNLLMKNSSVRFLRNGEPGLGKGACFEVIIG